MEFIPLKSSLPRIWCDFNACGWSGAPDDNCYYAFDEQAVESLGLTEGMHLLIYMDEENGEVVRCEARLERYNNSWRVCPDEKTWFRGRLS